MYQLLRRFLFLFPPEAVHSFSMSALRVLCSLGFRIKPKDAITTVKTGMLSGIKFRNPVGLGAGFDKNARYLHELEALGFGFVEIGTVTPKPQVGNDQPRLFRLPKDKALINRMGFNNEGVDVIANRLKDWKEKVDNRPAPANEHRLIIGG